MSLYDLQILFSDLTLGRIDVAAVEQLRDPKDAQALGYELTEREVSQLRAMNWHSVRRGLEAHHRIGDTLKRVRYLRDPTSGAYLGAQYPYPNPQLSLEKTMSESDKNDPNLKAKPQPSTTSESKAETLLGDLQQPVRYPPTAPSVDPSAYQPAAVRCAPAVDPSMYHPAAVRCAPAVDPSMYHPAAVRCAPAVDPSMY
ncbi:MAG: hypothetical protein JXB05_23280, partial [Myxococcaceae bacterium]|nr:hypothetical protein [Myxococcaceae bacterium]